MHISNNITIHNDEYVFYMSITISSFRYKKTNFYQCEKNYCAQLNEKTCTLSLFYG